MSRPRAFDAFPDTLRAEYSPTMGVVDRFVDPDTVIALFDCGWDVYPCHAIRLDNFSSPDGDPVEEKLMAFCAVRFPPGTPVRVRSKKLPRSFNQPMTFTRYAASMECAEGNIGLMLQAELDRLQEIGAG